MRRAWVALATFAVAWAAVLATSAAQTRYPLVLSDEALYLLPSIFGYTAENLQRWGSDFGIPIHLFHRVYGAFASTDVFLAGKLLNAAFFAAAAFPAFQVARGFLPVAAAVIFAIAAAMIPLSSVTRHFMPDAFFYFGYWCVLAAVFAGLARSAHHAALCGGIGAGLLSLVKPHALGVAAGLALFFFLRSARRDARAAALDVALLAAGYWAARALASFALSGQWELSLTGPMYGGLIGPARFDMGALLVSLAGHGASLALLAGVPALAALLVLRAPLPDDRLRELALLSVCMVAVLVAMTVAFSHSLLVATGGAHPVTRLHGRVWAYAIPLLVLCHAALLYRDALPEATRAPRLLLPAAVAAAIAALVLLRLYDNSVVDFADLVMLSHSIPGYGLLLGAVLVVAAGGWFLSRRFPQRVWLPALPLLWWGAVAVPTSLALAAGPLVRIPFPPHALHAPLVASPVVERLRGTEGGLIAGGRAAAWETFFVAFHLRSRAWLRFPPDHQLRAQDIPPGTRWLVLMPGVSYEGPGRREATQPVTVVRLP